MTCGAIMQVTKTTNLNRAKFNESKTDWVGRLMNWNLLPKQSIYTFSSTKMDYRKHWTKKQSKTKQNIKRQEAHNLSQKDQHNVNQKYYIWPINY